MRVAGLALLLSGCASVPDARAEVRAFALARAGIEEPARPLGALDADEAARLAIANHPRAREALAELGIARAAVLSARAPENPTVEGELGFSEGGERSVELGVEQSLTSLVYAARRSEGALAELEAAKQRAAAAVLELGFGARRAFVRWQGAAERVGLAERALLASEAALHAARMLTESGNATELSLHLQEDLHERAKRDAADAALSAALAREALDAAMGLWGEGAAWTAAAKLPEPRAEVAVEALEREAVERSLELEAMRHRIAGADSRAGLLGPAGWLPELSAGVRVRREGEDHGWFVGPTLSVELPVFDQGAGERGIAQAEAERDRERYAALAIELRARARAVAHGLLAARARLKQQREVILPLRAKIVAETLLAVNAMDASVFQLVEAKRAEIDAEREAVELLERATLAQLDADALRAGARPELVTTTTARPSEPPATGGAH